MRAWVHLLRASERQRAERMLERRGGMGMRGGCCEMTKAWWWCKDGTQARMQAMRTPCRQVPMGQVHPRTAKDNARAARPAAQHLPCRHTHTHRRPAPAPALPGSAAPPAPPAGGGSKPGRAQSDGRSEPPSESCRCSGPAPGCVKMFKRARHRRRVSMAEPAAQRPELHLHRCKGVARADAPHRTAARTATQPAQLQTGGTLPRN